MTPTIRTNSRPADGHIPADWQTPSLWSENWREIVGTAALVACLAGALVLAGLAVGVVS